MTQPTLTVLLDDGTGTFPYDISAYVLAADGYTITRGREDWQGAVTAGELNLTLNNSDGAFTPGLSPYGGSGFGVGGFGGACFVDQKIRLKETVNGVTYTRFTGYVKSWPVSWPATVATFAEVRLTATDAQARAERRPLRSALDEAIFADSPTAYYTLGESEGSTAAGDTSGHNAASLTQASNAPPGDIVFGTAIANLDTTGAAFDSTAYLAAPISSTILPSGAFTVEAVVVFPAVPALGQTFTILNISNTAGAQDSIELQANHTGQLVAVYVYSATSALAGGGSIADGLPHHVAFTYDGATTITAYVDGVSTGSVAAAAFGGPTVRFQVGQGASPCTGTIASVSYYSGTALSAGRIAAHASALTGSESGTARLTRLAGYAGIPVGTLDASLTNVSAATGWEGSTAAAEIQRTTDAELGLTYIDGTGALTFHNRNRVVAKTTPDLTLTSQWVTRDVTPVLDDQRIVNYMEVTAEGTGATGLVKSATSETAHGRYSGSQSYLVLTDGEALDRGNWIVANFAEPTPRYGTLTINLYGMTAVQAQTVIAALDMDCWLRVTSMAPQTPGGTVADVVVQGWSQTRTVDTWTIACNVVSRSLYAPVWVLGTSQLDVDTRLYV